MSTEPTTEPVEEEKKPEPPPPPPLPEKSSATRELTFTVPHILKSFAIDEAGFRHQDVRQGGPKQIDFTTEIEFSDTPVDEKADVFAIRATNQFLFANQVINVISDEVEPQGERGFRLVPTSPTATEYLKKVGSRVMVSSVCRVHRQYSEQQGKPIYQIARIFIDLP